jgi:hypothetical protein
MKHFLFTDGEEDLNNHIFVPAGACQLSKQTYDLKEKNL